MKQRERTPSDSEEERQLLEGIRLSMTDQGPAQDTSSSVDGKLKAKRESDDQLDRRTTKRPRTSNKPSSQTSSATSPNIAMAFPNGALRITRTPGRREKKNCINLGDLIRKEHLVSACVYAFFIARDELFRHLPLSQSSNDVPIYIGRDSNPNMDEIVPQAAARVGLTIGDKLTKKQLESIGPMLRQLCHERYGQNCHAFYAWGSGSCHSKILVLVYPGFLRLVITSCNMMDVDTELNDNHWYIHDAPMLSTRKSSPCSFETELLEHLQALGTPQEFIDSIQGQYDFSTVKVRLVTSIPGVHSGAKAEKYGLLRLRRVIMDLGLKLARAKSKEELRLEVCAASIGNLNVKWLDGFFDCAIGRGFIEVPDPADECEVPKELRIFYPTTEDVNDATGEPLPGSANIGCHTRPWVAAPKAVKDLFHHYHSKDVGRIFHQKLLIAYNPRDATALPYYVYVGSANLSQSAWGALEQDKKGNEATCGLKVTKTMNFECGIVVPGDILKSLLEPGTEGWQEGIVPYIQTAEKYDLARDKPWNDPLWVIDFKEDWRQTRRPCRFQRL